MNEINIQRRKIKLIENIIYAIAFTYIILLIPMMIMDWVVSGYNDGIHPVLTIYVIIGVILFGFGYYIMKINKMELKIMRFEIKCKKCKGIYDH